MISKERLLELWEATPGLVYEDALIVFARAVEREAYEAAAKVCDAKANELDPGDLGLANQRKAGIACGMCAAAIRALKKEGAD